MAGGIDVALPKLGNADSAQSLQVEARDGSSCDSVGPFGQDLVPILRVIIAILLFYRTARSEIEPRE
jgi:hypothetical protein